MSSKGQKVLYELFVWLVILFIYVVITGLLGDTFFSGMLFATLSAIWVRISDVTRPGDGNGVA